MDKTDVELQTEYERVLTAIQEWAEFYLWELQGNDTCYVIMYDEEFKEVPSAIDFLRQIIEGTASELVKCRTGARPWADTP